MTEGRILETMEGETVPKSAVVTLLQARVSGDTVRACEFLLQEARAGRLVGLAWAEIRPGYAWQVDVAGEAHRSPAFTQGIVLNLLRAIAAEALREK